MRGLTTNGSWNCGLLFCRPQRRPAADAAAVRPPANARVRRQPGDAVALEHVGLADADRRLAGLRCATARGALRAASAVDSVRVTPTGELLVEHVHVAVAGAAGRARDWRRLEVVHLAMAEADERRSCAVELLVDLDVDLVVVVWRSRQAIDSCSRCRARRRRQVGQHLAAKAVIALCGITPLA